MDSYSNFTLILLIMYHFTSKGWIVISCIPGRNGQYGSTTSIVGIFNTEKRANYAKEKYITTYIKNNNQKYINTHLHQYVSIIKIDMCKINEIILSEIYE